MGYLVTRDICRPGTKVRGNRKLNVMHEQVT